MGAGGAGEAPLAREIEGAGVVLEAPGELAVEHGAGAGLALGTRARPRVGGGALREVVAEVAAALDEGPEETAHEEREVAHVAMEGARAGRPGRGRAEPQHLDDAFEPRATGRAQVVEAARAREFPHYPGKGGGAGVLPHPRAPPGAPRERGGEGPQPAIPAHVLPRRLSP